MILALFEAWHAKVQLVMLNVSCLQPLGGRIMADRVASSPESFIELRHMAMCFTKIWLPVKGFLIGSECALPLPLIFQHDPEVEMGECHIRAVLYCPTVTCLRLRQFSDIVMKSPKIDMRFHEGRV